MLTLHVKLNFVKYRLSLKAENHYKIINRIENCNLINIHVNIHEIIITCCAFSSYARVKAAANIKNNTLYNFPHQK